MVAKWQGPQWCELGEWLYGTRERGDDEPEPREFESLTPTAIQVDWRVPTEFPCCPLTLDESEEIAYKTYAAALKFGVVLQKMIFLHLSWWMPNTQKPELPC